eukprot:scaffold33571_cov28-Tisochrysis_lutea.AAC.3
MRSAAPAPFAGVALPPCPEDGSALATSRPPLPHTYSSPARRVAKRCTTREPIGGCDRDSLDAPRADSRRERTKGGGGEGREGREGERRRSARATAHPTTTRLSSCFLPLSPSLLIL